MKEIETGNAAPSIEVLILLLTPEYRREIAKKAINARWAKAKKKARQKEQPPEP
jgi:hypothetical protein